MVVCLEWCCIFLSLLMIMFSWSEKLMAARIRFCPKHSFKSCVFCRPTLKKMRSFHCSKEINCLYMLTHGTLLPDSLPSSSRIAGSTQLLHLDAIRNTFAFWHSCFRGKKWATRRHPHFGHRWPRHWKVDRWCFWWRLGECLWGHNTDLSFFGAFFGFWLCFGLEKTDKLVTENEAFEICVGMSWGLWHHCSFSCSIRLPFRQSPQPKLMLLLHLCPSNFVRTKPNERQTASQMVVWPPTSFLVIFPWAPDNTIPAGLIKIGRETSVELLATARETKGGEWSFKAVRDEYLSNARMQKCNGKEY